MRLLTNQTFGGVGSDCAAVIFTTIESLLRQFYILWSYGNMY
jgi:hypothetical protein